MLQREHSAILATFIKLPAVIFTYVLSIFEWLFYTGFTVHMLSQILSANTAFRIEHGKAEYYKLKRTIFLCIM